MRIGLIILLVGWVGGWWLLWRVPRLRAGAPDDVTGPAEVVDVAVVIPARDEAATLPDLLASLATQTVRPRQVVVVDDGSTDGTAEVAAAFEGVTVVAGAELPEGWTGKSWACHQGVAATDAAVLVLLDADVTLAPGALAAVLAEHERRRGLVSVQPYHRVRRWYEQLSAPFNVIGVMGVGMASPGRDGRTDAAFGPCLVTTRADHAAVGGHEAVRGEIIDDVALGKAYAAAGLPVHALGGGQELAFRMYPGGIGQLVEGWSKNFASGAGATSVLRLALVGVWVTATLSSVRLVGEGIAGVGGRTLVDAAVCWALFAGQQRVLQRQVGSFRWLTALLYPVAMAGFVVVFVRSAWLSLVRRRVAWRGREIPLSHERRWRTAGSSRPAPGREAV